jgi:hypothetical protein
LEEGGVLLVRSILNHLAENVWRKARWNIVSVQEGRLNMDGLEGVQISLLLIDMMGKIKNMNLDDSMEVEIRGLMDVLIKA